MKKWTRPIFEAFEANGEVTAYAGAARGDAPPPRAGAGEDRITGPEPAPCEKPTDGSRREAV